MSEKEQAENLNRPDEWFVYNPIEPDFLTFKTEDEARAMAES